VSKEFKVGIIVTAAIAILVIGINYLKGEDFFARSRDYYAVYDHIDGLSTSNPVIINGFKIGVVKKIRLSEDGTGKLVVHFSINQPDINVPTDSKAKIFSADFFGSKAIELVQGESTEMAESGSELQGLVEQDIAAALKAELEPLKKRTESLVKDLDDILANIKALFDDESTQGLPQSFQSLQRSLMTLETTAGRVDEMVAENKERLKSIIGNADRIASNLAANNDKITSILANLDKIGDQAAKLDFVTTIDNANKAIAQLTKVLEEVNNGTGTVGKLVQNDSLYNNLNSSGEQLDRLLEDMRVNPSRYINFSLISRKDRDGFTKEEKKQIKQQIEEVLKEKKQ